MADVRPVIRFKLLNASSESASRIAHLNRPGEAEEGRMRSDRLLSDNDRKEQLSVAFAKAIAAKAGYVTSQPSLDRDSVDLTVSAGGDMSPSLALQMKATSVATWTDAGLPFVLKRKNYDDLRARRIIPLILVVLEMPQDESDWFIWKEDELVLRRCAWWLSIKGSPAIETESRTVHIPRSQPFNADSLPDLMRRIREGQL